MGEEIYYEVSPSWEPERPTLIVGTMDESARGFNNYSFSLVGMKQAMEHDENMPVIINVILEGGGDQDGGHDRNDRDEDGGFNGPRPGHGGDRGRGGRDDGARPGRSNIHMK